LDQPQQIRPGAIYHAEKPARDPEYRRFVKQFPCVGCGKTWGIDPAHTGPHGLGQKASDLDVLPLCRRCHDAYDRHPSDFAIIHKLDIPALIEMFNGFYQIKLGGGKAA
jgi:hypothetical protein